MAIQSIEVGQRLRFDPYYTVISSCSPLVQAGLYDHREGSFVEGAVTHVVLDDYASISVEGCDEIIRVIVAPFYLQYYDPCHISQDEILNEYCID